MASALWVGCVPDSNGSSDEARAGNLENAARDLGPPKRVFARRFVTPVRRAPRQDASALGYLRAGAVVGATTSQPIGFQGCAGGWYELQTGGFLCHGREAIAFEGERLPELRTRQPDRDGPLPYEYATVRVPTPVYKRLPRTHELIELGVESEAEGEPSSQSAQPLMARVLQPGFYVSLDRRFVKDGARFWRTQQHGYVSE